MYGGSRTRTWLLWVEHNGKPISAENITGSRNFIPRLMEVCSILVSNTGNELEEYSVHHLREQVVDLSTQDVRNMATAWSKVTANG